MSETLPCVRKQFYWRTNTFCVAQGNRTQLSLLCHGHARHVQMCTFATQKYSPVKVFINEWSNRDARAVKMRSRLMRFFTMAPLSNQLSRSEQWYRIKGDRADELWVQIKPYTHRSLSPFIYSCAVAPRFYCGDGRPEHWMPGVENITADLLRFHW